MSFQNNDTICCSRNVKNPFTGEYMDPSTSMTICIISPNGTYIETHTLMTKDEVGKYHFDFQSEGYPAGPYKVIYTATDGARKSTIITSFFLESIG